MERITEVPQKTIGNLKLRVRAVGNRQGWYYVIDQDHRPIAADFGPLPSGYKFTDETATMFALAQAHRYIGRHLPGARVVITCVTPRRPAFNSGRWAA